jgi:hypothetical protein
VGLWLHYGPNKPPSDPQRITRELGGYIILMRLHAQRASDPLQGSLQGATQRLEGYYRVPGAGYPRQGPQNFTKSPPGKKEANPRRETQSQNARGQPQVRDTITTRPRPTLGGRRGHDLLKANLNWEMHSRLA